MGRYLIQRLAFALLLVFIVSSASLVLTRLAPGDFSSGECMTLSAEECLRLRARLGLDRPIAAQYVEWLGNALRFDFGQSMLYSRPVSAMIGERALNTMVLAIVALLTATVIGIPLGIYSGTARGAGRNLVRFIFTLAISIPPLIGSLALVFLAARTGWLPVGGMTSNTGIDASWGVWLADLAHHIPVPALALAIPLAA